MKKKSKTIYTPHESFDCKRPLGWDEITKKLINAIYRYNQAEKKRWEKSFFLRLFWHPTEYKVEAQATGNSETMKLSTLRLITIGFGLKIPVTRECILI
jgi:hypothetical protein